MFNQLVALMFIWAIVGNNLLNAQKGRFQKVVLKGGLITTVDAENLVIDINLSDTLEVIQYHTSNTFNTVEVYKHELGISSNKPIKRDSIIYEKLMEYSKRDYNTCDSNLILKPYEIIKRGKVDKQYQFIDIRYTTKLANEAYTKDIEEECEFRYIVYYERFMYVDDIVYTIQVSSNRIKLKKNTNQGDQISKKNFKCLLRRTRVGGNIISPSLQKLMTQENSSCSAQKKVLEQYFYWNDYIKTIALFKKYKPCYKDKEKFHLKLGLLYHKTNQNQLAKMHCEKYLSGLAGQKRLSEDGLNCNKAYVYLLLGLDKEMKQALTKIEEGNLSKKERAMFQYLNSIENISSVGFELNSLFN